MQHLIQGITVGVVTNNLDPNVEGRIEVRFMEFGEDTPTRWCQVASVAAGDDRGVFFAPEVDDEVIVAFDQGDIDHPYIIGYTWNPVQRPPTTSPNERMIRSRSGHTIRLIDVAETGGNSGALIIHDSHGNAITMTNGGITINANGHLDINASSMRIAGRVVNPLAGEI